MREETSVTQQENEKYSPSRRSFLKFAVAGGALAAGAVAGGLPGCTSEGEAGASPAAQSSQGEAVYNIIDTDLLVIGGGLNATSAIWAAIKKGTKVLMVDKGPFRQSGASGMCWDAFSPGINNPADTPLEDYYLPWLGQPIGDYQVNQLLWKNALAANDYDNNFVKFINEGQYIADRQEDGTIAPYAGTMCMSQFFRRNADGVFGTGLVSVVDQTMITDLIISGDTCYGAMGIHIPTGAFRVFRSRATIIATGACTWIYGRVSIGALTNNSPDNTADVDMAAFRSGIGIGDAEYCQYDVVSIEPKGMASRFGGIVTGDAQEAHAMQDVNGDPVFEEDDEQVYDRNYFCRRLAEVISAENRGTENGGIYLSIGDSAIRYANDRNIPLLEKFNVYPRTELIEAAPEMYEHGGMPVVDENMMTSVNGLFASRGSGIFGENGGSSVWTNILFGNYAGKIASDYLASTEFPAEMDWEPVNIGYERIQNIRNNAPSAGKQPFEIRRSIQDACMQGLGLYRTTDALEASIAEFERIRAEDIPAQVVSDPSNVFNRDLMMAIENINLLDIAEISVRASLMREETRGSYLRVEFPERDDDNWACMLVCKNIDGAMVFEKVELPKA